MKWNQVATGLLLTLLVFTGCKSVEVQDGRIPNDYLSQAQKLSGVYKGMFNNVLGDLIIGFEGDRAVVTYRNDRGNDILGMNCGSRIGNLQRVTIKGDAGSPQVTSAVFAFDPGRCYKVVLGREITFNFKQTDEGLRIEAGLRRDLSGQQYCRTHPGAANTISRCRKDSNNAAYYIGTFVR